MSEPAWAARFWSKVDFDGPIPPHRPDLGRCYVWTRSINVRRGGYGQFRLDGRIRKAHLLALELAGVPIPKGMEPDHLCQNPACVRVTHIEITTRRTNFLRGSHPNAVAVRTNRCSSGHTFTPENTITKPDGRRECRTCHNRAQNERLRARKTAAP